ncbi:MAG: class I SAM-dependent methyltransferase [Parcubacteria group bacterium]|nr:class I SAM-dependent methyltransferase [Parcubacteria group bacterium]
MRKDGKQEGGAWLTDELRAEMIFYATTNDYSDAERYEKFARACNLHKKAFEIGAVVRGLIAGMHGRGNPVEILETASATGLTAVGIMMELVLEGVACSYTSLDREQNLLDYAKERGRGDIFVQGDFEDLPFSDDSFDVYIMMGAAGYRPKGTFYSEVWRVLKLGGYYVMPQIGPQLSVSKRETNEAEQAGFTIIRADNYLIAQKIV